MSWLLPAADLVADRDAEHSSVDPRSALVRVRVSRLALGVTRGVPDARSGAAVLSDAVGIVAQGHAATRHALAAVDDRGRRLPSSARSETAVAHAGRAVTRRVDNGAAHPERLGADGWGSACLRSRVRLTRVGLGRRLGCQDAATQASPAARLPAPVADRHGAVLAFGRCGIGCRRGAGASGDEKHDEDEGATDHRGIVTPRATIVATTQKGIR